MRRHGNPAVLAAVLALAFAPMAAAQQGAEQQGGSSEQRKDDPSPPLASPEQDLYQQALQSIAEGRKSDASEALTRVVEGEPLHAGAWLDLALIQCDLGHADEAERLFKRIETRFAPPPGIMALITDARARGCQRWQTHSQTSLLLGRGIDQNVNQGSVTSSLTVVRDGIPVDLQLDNAFVPRHDQYTQLSGEYVRDLSPNGSIGFAQFQLRRNDHLNQYDSNSLFTGVESPWRFGRWTLRGTGMVGLISLGGKLYQRQYQLHARIGPPVPLPGSTQFNVLGGVTHNDYLTLTNFNSNTAELKGQFTYRDAGRWASATFGYLNDHGIGQRPGGDRHGWLTSLQARRALPGDVTGELGYTRQNWHSQSAYSPGLIETIREQRTEVLRGTLIYPLGKSQSLQLEARLVRDRENISIFQYNNRQLQLSWQWSEL